MMCNGRGRTDRLAGSFAREVAWLLGRRRTDTRVLEPSLALAAIPKLIGLKQEIGNVALMEAFCEEPPF
jgi:hypothetical protein